MQICPLLSENGHRGFPQIAAVSQCSGRRSHLNGDDPSSATPEPNALLPAVVAKQPRPCLGRGPASRSDDIDLPEPLRGFCLGFSLAEGHVVIAWYRQLIPALWATLFRDTCCDSGPARPVHEGVTHGYPHFLGVDQST